MIKNSNNNNIKKFELNDTSIGYIAGAANGFSQVIVGHPLDTIKVYLQTTGKYNVSYRHLIRGIAYPLMSMIPTVSLQFGTENLYSKIVKKEEDEFTWSDGFLSGAITGLTCAPIISVTELYRIRRQKFETNRNFKLNLGMGMTILREIPAVAMYFGVYKYTSNVLEKKGYNDFYTPLIAGGAGGGLSWFFNYPIDVIKTRIQAGDCKTILEGFRMGKIFKGIGIYTFRGTLVNGVGFFTYEKSKKILSGL